MIVLREMNLAYFSNVFYITNFITLTGEEDIYNSLNIEYHTYIENYFIT